MTTHRFLVLLLYGFGVVFCCLPGFAWAVDWWRKELKRRRLGGELYERKDGKIAEKDEPNRYSVDID